VLSAQSVPDSPTAAVLAAELDDLSA
jgi:hypothetical protein